MKIEDKLVTSYILRHSREVLFMIDKLEIQEVANLVDTIPLESAALLVSGMDRYKAARTIEKLSIDKAVSIVEVLSSAVAINILLQVNDELRLSILDKAAEEKSKSLAVIMKYPQNSVGANLSPLVFTLPGDITIDEAMVRVRNSELPVTQKIFVLGKGYKLEGVVDLHDLIITSREKSIRAILNPDPPRVLADRSIEPFLKGDEWVDPYPALAVVDIEGIFLGALSRESLSRINVSKKTLDQHAVVAGNALGDLFRIGISGLFRSAIELTNDQKT